MIRTKIKYLIFVAFNLLYKIYFPLYKILYFKYKGGEKGEINFFRKNIKKRMTVVDVGANIGFYTILFSKLVGKKGKVYAFEPGKENFKHLKRICRKLKNVEVVKKAVGDKNTTIRLYESNILNVDHITYESSEKRNSYPVKSISLDSFFRNKNIDFVKIDTQGFEYQVLKGMKNTLVKNKKLGIFCEFQTSYLRRSNTKASDILNFLKKSGMKVRVMRDKNLDFTRDDRTFHSNIYAKRA